jgi:hypothetical protein
MTKTRKFDPPIIGVETVQGISVFYNRLGDYSVLIKCENPVFQYSADIDLYYDFHSLFANVLKILGSGYVIQKQDVFCKRKFKSPTSSEDFLSQRYFAHFDGRIYTDISTYIIITGETNRNKFFSFDSKKFDIFLRNVHKIMDLFSNKGVWAKLMNEAEINAYIRRFFTLNFNKKVVGLENIIAKEEYLKIGKKAVKSVSLVDIDEVNFPSFIRPCKEVNIGMRFPVDLMSFLNETPNAETLVYNQTIIIPDQRGELNKLDAKRKKHSGMPDPANALCVNDIDKVMADIAKDGQLLIYTNYNIIVAGENLDELDKAINFIESSLFDSSIIVSRQCYNQLELFECSLPGNAASLPIYDRFLTTSDTGLCLLFKERLQVTEDSPFLTYFTNRQGLPIGIDTSGKEGMPKRTNNSNFFVLGPSGSGKSFYVNSKVRQWYLADTDIVIVDTGHSYSGLCDYYNGRYITYTKEKPITMNPFRIVKEEYNEEKIDFLKSLVALLWKGSGETINQVEDTLLTNIVTSYYEHYWNPKGDFLTDDEKEDIREKLTAEWEAEEVHAPEIPDRDALDKHIQYKIYKAEEHRKKGTFKVESLSFNTFFEFAVVAIEQSMKIDGIRFDLTDFSFILKKFYKGGKYEKILNDDFDSTLFDEKFIVFEIDAIKENETLFPIVTLIIMDVFLQKMRLKNNRKALIIEEAWKAIASPMMAGYILYLYKTVRKHWGMAMVVTQELEDIISNAVVKNSIVNNSDIICLLDQTKFKDNYDEIANLLSISDVERRKIFTINNLQNREGRNRFNEVYIKRGQKGEVYGVEVSLHEYFTFTTERIEKDTVSYYQAIYGNFQDALECFVSDLKKSKLKQGEWVRQASTVLGHLHKQGTLSNLFKNGIANEESLCNFIKNKYEELKK